MFFIINCGGRGTADFAMSATSMLPATAAARLRKGTGVGIAVFGVSAQTSRRTGDEQLS